MRQELNNVYSGDFKFGLIKLYWKMNNMSSSVSTRSAGVITYKYLSHPSTWSSFLWSSLRWLTNNNKKVMFKLLDYDNINLEIDLNQSSDNIRSSLFFCKRENLKIQKYKNNSVKIHWSHHRKLRMVKNVNNTKRPQGWLIYQ